MAIDGKSITLILPTYSEKDSIRDCILGFEELEIIDEILVVDNNAELGTIEQISDLNIRIIKETIQGYGSALKCGIRNSSGDLVVLCEPDGTFSPSDLKKLLSYTNECDVVFGSRTVQTFIWGDANMGWFLRWGNWFVAKILEVLFNSSYMSDVGCTFRVLNRNAIEFLKSRKLSNSSSFGLEMQVEVIKSRELTYVQIPVRYGARIGNSTITGAYSKSIKLGLRMIGEIILRRFS